MPLKLGSGQGSYTFLEMGLPSQVRSHSCIRLYYNRLAPRQRNEMPHSHIDVEMDLFGDCIGTYVIGDKSYSIESGDIFILRSNEQHSIVSLKGGGSRCVCTGLQFTPDFIWSPSNELGSLSSMYEIFVDTKPKFNHKLSGALKVAVAKEFNDIVEEFTQRRNGYELVVKMKLVLALVSITRELASKSLSKGYRIQNEKRVMVEKALNFLDEHYLEPLTLSSIAGSVNMSPSYLEQLFKKLNGFTIWDYILSKRIEDAKRCLATSDIRVLDISMKCGFTSLTHFNRVFRRITGSVPKEYRKKMQIEA